MTAHRISAGALIEADGRLLLVRNVKSGHYDFWVAPGGGVKADETLEQAVAREVLEETGLQVQVGPLRYIEDLVSPTCRTVKFWFGAVVIGGRLDTSHPEAQQEHIVEAAWLAAGEWAGKTVFPELLQTRYAADRAAGFPSIVRLPLRVMTVG
ncbi:MAG: NUDIX domain-containing protein [Rubrivivax sp.]|jgi:8-oxo-dGTP diphosphatase